MARGSHHSSSHHSGSHHSSSHHSSSHHSSSHHSYHHGYHSSHRSSANVHTSGHYKAMEYNILYREQDYLINDIPNASTGETQNTGAEIPNSKIAEPTHDLVLHATTQYNSEHKKIRVNAPDALGPGSEKPMIHDKSWVLGDAYCLDLDDPYCKAHHPKLKKADPLSYTIIGCFIASILFFAALGNGIYEILIFIFENINMTDEAFYAVDNVIYYGQFILPLIIMIFVLIKKKSIHKMNLMFVKQMLQYYAVEDEKLHFDRTHEFLDICPQCGAARLPDTRECPYCGTSLLRMIDRMPS